MRTPAAPIFTDVRELRAYAGSRRAGCIVLANGCFDPLHVGHIRYLEDACTHGDFLAVALNNDASTRRLKGSGRPVVDDSSRARLLAALAPVDAVLLFGDDTVEGILEALRPAVHAKGTDYTASSVPEAGTASRLGIRTVITGDSKSHASREIVARIRSAAGETSSS